MNIASLHFDSFDEAVHCVHALWQALPSHRKELTLSLLTILPDEKGWYGDDRFLRSIRLLFFILATPDARPDDARRVLTVGNSKEVASLCAEATTLDLFLYLWNFYGLWFSGERAEGEPFEVFLHAEIQKAVKEVLKNRFQRLGDQQETDNLIALAGLSSFTGLALDSLEKTDWSSRLPAFEKLHRHALAKTFVPAVFFLVGLEWIFDKEGAVSRRTWQEVLPKAEMYSEKPVALEYLCKWVRARSKNA